MKYRLLGWGVLSLLLAFALMWILWSAPSAHLEHLPMTTGGVAKRVSPADDPKAYLLLVATPQQQLTDTQLLKLAAENGVQGVQWILDTSSDCAAQSRALQEAIQHLGATPTLVAGIDRGAVSAWRWLATENREDTTLALSVGFSLAHPDCEQPVPQRASKGHWRIAWNNSPDEATALFVREQSRVETIISPYDTPLPTVLFSQIKRALQGQADPVPVVEVPATAPASDTLTLFYSGDGGWRDLDRDIAERMAKQGFPVVGIDVLRYFWQHKSLEQAAADLEQLMQHYREHWGIKRFVFAGYSFGADILPPLYNRLPVTDQQQTDVLLLLALARSGGLEVEVQGWLGKVGDDFKTGPELVKIPEHKLFCVYGLDEQAESGCTQAEFKGEVLALPGGHHFDQNYEALAERLMAVIRARQTP